MSLPSEDPDHRNTCGLLLKHMYGTQAAADGWQQEYSATMNKLGFTQGLASPCVFWHKERDLVCSVHGDDFTTAGAKAHLDWFESQLESQYELRKGGRIGPGPKDCKEGRILNRIVRWTDTGIEYEADPRQVEKLVESLSLEGANSVVTPGLKPLSEQILQEKPLPPGEHTLFRGHAARGNYLAADRPDVQFAAKEVCRWMANPTDLSLVAMKRLGRYLSGRRRLVYRYPWQSADTLECYSDTDWAGCPKSRKSTSGGCLMLGSHVLKTWSSTQPSISLSSGEAEYYGVVKAAGIALGQQSLMKDLGIDVRVRVWTDSSAAIGICGRSGLGKLRHVQTHTLWVQERVRTGAIELRKVHGDVNPADLFTKHLSSRDRINQLVQLFNCEFREGRAESAPLLRRQKATAQGGTVATVAATQIDRERPNDKHETDDDRRRPDCNDHDDSTEQKPHDPSYLPHEFPDEEIEKFFPIAVASVRDDGIPGKIECICSRPECARCFPRESVVYVEGMEAW